jgi:ParB-like nuclease domain
MSDNPNGSQIEQEAKLQWVPLSQMQVNPVAQRDFNLTWARELAAKFDIEEMGNPAVSHRDGAFNIIDGQHRVAGLKLYLGEGNWEEREVECRVYEGLTDQEEAEKFLKLNNRLKPHSFDDFRVSVSAGRETEAEIDRIVGEMGLKISRAKDGISATGTLKKLYTRGGQEVLARTLMIIRDAYGEAGFEAAIIEGVGLVIQRYAGEVRDEALIKKLASAKGGSGGLLNKANQLRLTTGNQKGQCVAAAVVELANRGPGGKKLPSWWRAA